MTKTQIEEFLNELDYELNRSIKLSEVSSIYLITDNAIYPSNTTRFVFSTEDNAGLLLIYNGTEDNQGNFIPAREAPDEIISFDAIAGFTMASDYHPYELFKTARAA